MLIGAHVSIGLQCDARNVDSNRIFECQTCMLMVMAASSGDASTSMRSCRRCRSSSEVGSAPACMRLFFAMSVLSLTLFNVCNAKPIKGSC